MKQGILSFVLLAVCTLHAVAQDSTNTETKIKKPTGISLAQADHLFEQQQYREALNAYAVQYQQMPKNPDIAYKMGLCYHYLLFRPDLCITYFGASANSNNTQYNFYKNAPTTSVDALYFMGKSFMALNQVDSAIKYFVYYQQRSGDSKKLDATRQLNMCVNNQELTQQPRPVAIHNLQEPVNTPHNESNPVVSIDNQIMFFSSRKPDAKKTGEVSDNDIYIAKAINDSTWDNPEPFAFNTPGDDEALWISTDGKKLYLRRVDKKGGDIYVSEKGDAGWGKPTKVPGINSIFDERGFSMSADGQMIVVSSNRPGGEGGYDLYVAKGKDGHWGGLKNMGKTVNSQLDEIYPFIHPTEKKIYFSSNGSIKYGTGNFDLFFTQQDSAQQGWSEPFTLGYPINKGGNEICYYATAYGKRFYSAINRSGDLDIFEIKSGTEDENKEDKVIVEKADATVTGQEVAVVELLQVEKEKIVEKDKEVEVTKIETLEKDVDKNVGNIDIADTGKVDKLVAIVEKEVRVETIVEKEVPMKPGTSPEGPTQYTIPEDAKEKPSENNSRNENNKDNNTANGDNNDNTPNAPAAKNEKGETALYYSVKPGATLFSISREYNVPVEQLKKWNKLKSNSLTRGQQLIVGYGNGSSNEGLPSVRQLEKAGISEKERRLIIDSIKTYYTQKINEEHSTIFKTLYFEFNSKELTISKNELDLLVTYLTENKNVNVEVLGHTDNTGEWEANFWVSRLRAKMVYDYLIGKKISKNRIIFNGKGSTMPIASNESKEGRAKNRRVEIILIQ